MSKASPLMRELFRRRVCGSLTARNLIGHGKHHGTAFNAKTYHSCTPGVETKSIQLDMFTIGINKTVPMVIAQPSGFELIDFSGNHPLCIAVASNIRDSQ